MSAAAGAIGGLVDVVISHRFLNSNSISEFLSTTKQYKLNDQEQYSLCSTTKDGYQGLKTLAANILLKAGAAAALTYINYDYSEDKLADALEITDTTEQVFDNL